VNHGSDRGSNFTANVHPLVANGANFTAIHATPRGKTRTHALPRNAHTVAQFAPLIRHIV